MDVLLKKISVVHIWHTRAKRVPIPYPKTRQDKRLSLHYCFKIQYKEPPTTSPRCASFSASRYQRLTASVTTTLSGSLSCSFPSTEYTTCCPFEPFVTPAQYKHISYDHPIPKPYTTLYNQTHTLACFDNYGTIHAAPVAFIFAPPQDIHLFLYRVTDVIVLLFDTSVCVSLLSLPQFNLPPPPQGSTMNQCI